ncbi:hypothetical protein [Bradyrhizobium cosmicum]|uniref:hypothetical protein n=1 Tax=Bradyrhizobium cosmicum TaxID=1404864 RepID=UPI0028E9C09B|nr:hypothetical protein [Bradyrhizobium cosmicum]
MDAVELTFGERCFVAPALQLLLGIASYCFVRLLPSATSARQRVDLGRRHVGGP